MNINGTRVLLAVAIAFTVASIALATVKVLGHYNLVVFYSDGLRWLTDDWFGYMVAAIAITLLLAFSYFRCPPDQRSRFGWSSLHWCNLWHCRLIAARVSVNLVRDDVLQRVDKISYCIEICRTSAGGGVATVHRVGAIVAPEGIGDAPRAARTSRRWWAAP